MSDKPTFKALFPPDLLKASDEARLDYFEQVVVDHPNFNDLLSEIFGLISRHSNRRIFLLVGATGTGKSALMRKLVERVIAEAMKAGLVGPEIVPAFSFRPIAPRQGIFKFETLYEQALYCMKAPLVDASRDVLAIPLSPRETVRRLLLESTARKDFGGMRTRCLDNLRDRKVRLWGLDEAKVLFMTGRSDTKKSREAAIEDMADRLKLLVEDVNTTLLLGGGFDFYSLSLVTAQLARRCRVFYFQPYTGGTIAGFQKGFIGLLSQIPAQHLIAPSDGPEFLRRCDGAIGRVRDVLMDALFKHLTRKVTLDMTLVRECFWEADQEEVMQSESDAGDRHMKAVKTKSVERAKAGGTKKEGNPSTSPPKLPADAQPRKVGEARPSHHKDASGQW